MQQSEYQTFTPSKIDDEGSYQSGKKAIIPGGFLLIYLVLAAGFCLLYHIKLVATADWNATNSINAVASFETAKPFQFRLLIPMIFTIFKPLLLIYGKYVYSAYNIIIVTALISIFYKLLCHYFKNRRLMLWIAPVILYPMLWNYILLNGSFQYYDFTTILITTLGLYYIVKQNYTGFLIVFIAGLINKETIAYLIFSYALFNYKEIFTAKIILRGAILSLLFIGYKLFLNYIFRDNPGDSFEVGYYENIRIVQNLLSNKILLRNFLLNFGGLYVFVILLFLTGAWLRFPDRRLVLMNLAIVPYYIFGIYITYITEVRVYTELIPMITILFLIYLSNFKNTGFFTVKEG